MKTTFAILSLVIVSACGTAKSNGSDRSDSKPSSTDEERDCPTAPLRGLSGNFQGILQAVNFQGESQPQQNLMETQAITSCTSFTFDIHYSNPATGEETRRVEFSAEWDKTNANFAINGAVIKGVMRVLRQGQFVTSFETAFAGKPAHCEEMITLTNGDRQMTRSVQCSDGGLDGLSLGVRTALASRVP